MNERELREIEKQWRIDRRVPEYFPRAELGETETAHIKMGSNRITISPEFIDESTEKLVKLLGLDEEKAKFRILYGVLDHEFGHWDYFPYSPKLSKKLREETKKLEGIKPEQIGDVENYFSDLLVNLNLVESDKLEILDVYETLADNAFDALLASLYFLTAGIKPENPLIRLYVDTYRNISGEEKKEILEKGEPENLTEALVFLVEGYRNNYFTRKMWKKGLEYFWKTIKRFMPEKIEGRLDNNPPDDTLEKRRREEKKRRRKIRENRKRDMRDNPEKYTYRELKNEFGELEALILFAKANIKKLSLPEITKTSQSAIRVGSKPWSHSDRLEKIDPYKSLKIGLPGLTKQKNYMKGNISTGLKGSPNLFLVMDRSGSMYIAWESAKKAAATLLYYIYTGGGRATIAMFDDKLVYSSPGNLRDAVKFVLENPPRGNTYLDISKMEEAQKNVKPPYMAVLIGDFEFNEAENKQEVLEYFKKTGYFVIHISPEDSQDLKSELGHKYIRVDPEQLDSLPEIIMREVVG